MFSRIFGAIFVLMIALTAQSHSWTPSRILDSRLYRNGDFHLGSEETEEDVEPAHKYPCVFVTDEWGVGKNICPTRPESQRVNYQKTINMRSIPIDGTKNNIWW